MSERIDYEELIGQLRKGDAYAKTADCRLDRCNCAIMENAAQAIRTLIDENKDLCVRLAEKSAAATSSSPAAPLQSDSSAEAERSYVISSVATIIDHPSVYMGGPSARAKKLAERIVKALESQCRLSPTTCTHSAYVNYRQHGTRCPDCGSQIEERSASEAIPSEPPLISSPDTKNQSHS